MTYACICGWSVHTSNDQPHEDIFLNHFHGNTDAHKLGGSQDSQT